MSVIYRCEGKGGRYRLLGRSKGAGTQRGSELVVYECLDTGQLYHRQEQDFITRMTPLRQPCSEGQPDR